MEPDTTGNVCGDHECAAIEAVNPGVNTRADTRTTLVSVVEANRDEERAKLKGARLSPLGSAPSPSSFIFSSSLSNAMVEADQPVYPPSKLGEYTVVQEIAEGTFGKVKSELLARSSGHLC